MKKNAARLSLVMWTAVSLLGAIGCGQSNSLPASSPVPTSAAPAPVLQSGIDLTSIDASVRPQDDFYRYANGAWLTRTPIPEDASSYTMFSMLRDKVDDDLRAIIDELSRQPAASGTNQQKITDYYQSYMDTNQIEARGVQPLQAYLQAIASADNPGKIAYQMGYLSRMGVLTPLGLFVDSDDGNPGTQVLWLTQSGLSLPWAYYLEDEASYLVARQAMLDYAGSLFQAVGHPSPQQAATTVLAIETALARIQLSPVDDRDAIKNYNPRTSQQVASLFGVFDWASFAEGTKASGVSKVAVRSLSFFERFGSVFASFPVEAWRDYLTFQMVDRFAPYLDQAIESRHFAFHSTVLRGIPAAKPRWQTGVQEVNAALPEALGEEYVRRYFSPEAKQRTQDLVNHLLKAYGQSIRQAEWMSPPTKTEALDKLSKIGVKVGYPEKWRDYSALLIDPADLVGNTRRAAEFQSDVSLAKADQPLDPAEWFTKPQEVNAYYSPNTNEIVFPAAILQPPFFTVAADDAINYGGIGMVIGHEIGHAFDDQGSQYDGDGRLRNWWTEADRVSFDALGDRLAAQYDKFSSLPGLFVDGRLTLGENLGDLAGLTIAYRAYQDSLDGTEAPVLDGFTGPQRFFVGFAQIWRAKYRDEEARNRLLSDPHAPPIFRVLGTLPNLDGFYDTYGLQAGDKMSLPPDQRVKIW